MTMPLTYQRELAALQAERDALARDLADAASDFPVPLPEPGSDMAKVITANRLLRAERDDLARQLGDITAVVAACKHLPQRDTIAETIRAADDRIGALASSSSHPIAEVVGEEFKALASHVGISKRYEEASRQRVTPMSPRALASIIKGWCYRRAKREADQARHETLREAAKAMGAEEAFKAMVSLVGAEKTTPECFAEMLRMCAASSPSEVALQFKAAKIERYTSTYASAWIEKGRAEARAKYGTARDQPTQLIPGFVTEQNGDTFKVVGLADPFTGIMDGAEMMPLGDDEGDQ